MYKVYKKWKRDKRAKSVGFATDSLDRAKEVADRATKSWWGMAGCFDWVKVKDTETGKYIYTA